MFVYPHGVYVDRDDNIWVTDGQGKGNKGQQVVEFSPTGRVLKTLGTPGVAGAGPDTFISRPTCSWRRTAASSSLTDTEAIRTRGS
jgi:hypothetical protein